ncbi:hypothetical protein GCM10008179_06260 [Hansschlegelia plantiphila]|uniref:Translation initiation factor IF-2 n=1 Tax=Hansschlegelia plantiphila TaxID=374655 RepID=A0A9W6MUK4_9HYPH|nr:hypothetical protein GCM10008179_06260 [Hansschlegelia plantiphila]
MRRWFMRLLAASALIPLGFAVSARAEYRTPSIIAEPSDQRPGAVTRPAGAPDRAARRGRRSPEIVTAPQTTIRPLDPPRYGANGRRVNVPGRPDTLDAFGRSRIGLQREPIVQSGPTVRTDAATRINQFPPR